MNKTNQFSAKVQYVTPSCRSVELRSASTILTGSNPWNNDGSRSIGEDDVDTQDGWFGM